MPLTRGSYAFSLVMGVSTVAEKILKPDKMVWVVVGDRSKIEAGIRELNYGELRIVDADGNPVK